MNLRDSCTPEEMLLNLINNLSIIHDLPKVNPKLINLKNSVLVKKLRISNYAHNAVPSISKIRYPYNALISIKLIAKTTKGKVEKVLEKNLCPNRMNIIITRRLNLCIILL